MKTREKRMGPETLIWKGRSWNATLLLFPHQLVIQPFGKRVELNLEDIENAGIRQHFFGRLCDKGDLWLKIRGKKTFFWIRGLKNPYEGWKQIKIARFQTRKLIDK